MLVDDDAPMTELFLSGLTASGHEVAVATSGRQALERLEEEPFDLMLLDVVMPGMDGLEVLREVRRTRSPFDLPVIMITIRDRRDDVIEALSSGANDYINKPVDIPILLARVFTHLNLRRLARMQDDFLSIAAHDLRSPIATIRGNATFLEDMVGVGTPLDADAFHLLVDIRKTADHMLGLLDAFLSLQALESGAIHLEKVSADLNRVVEEAVERNRRYARSKNIALAVEVDPSLPGFPMDVIRLGQVAQNLVNNAIKFGSEGGHVWVRTSIRDGEAWLEVADDGPGLTGEDLGRIFVKGVRLSNRPTAGEPSNRLGLAICKQLVEMHHGELTVENNPGCGVTFRCRFPLTVPALSQGDSHLN